MLAVYWGMWWDGDMARPLRVNIPDGWYHCMNRGLERRAIFADDRDCRHFVDLLGEIVDRFRVRVHAYCLLGNHYHTIIQTPDANLSQAMQWVGLSYSSWFNTRHNRDGPLFHGRFKSIPVEQGAWVHELSMYLHLNPVRRMAFGLDKRSRKAEGRGLTRAPTKEEVTARLKTLREHPWSSYRAYAGYERGAKWLTTADILRRSARNVDDRKKKYRAGVRAILGRGVDESRLEKFRSAVGIGSSEFIDRIKGMAGDGMRETERRGRLRERVSFEQVVCAVEELRAEPSGEWLNKHGDWGKWMVLKLARRYSGMTLAQLGEQMGGVDYAAIGMGLLRFEQRLGKSRDLKRTCAAAERMLDV